jgi:hypothetical protein
MNYDPYSSQLSRTLRVFLVLPPDNDFLMLFVAWQLLDQKCNSAKGRIVQW